MHLAYHAISCYTAPVGIKIVLNDDAVLDAILALSKQVLGITKLQGELMATLQDVKNEIDNLKTAIDKEKGEVSAALQVLKDQIAALQAQIASGSGVTSADLDGLVASVKDAEGKVDAISGAPAPVTP